MMKVSFYTLGCKVNQYETQSMREQFENAGYELAEQGGQADICVINTCSVTNVADRKSRQYIRRMKALNPDAVIVVTGCYAQTDPQSAARIDGVNIIAGTNEKSHIAEYVSGYLQSRKLAAEAEEKADSRQPDIHVLKYEELDTYEDLGTITAMESRSRAFIKIEEGCDRFCSYCIIPYARGKVRSRSVRSVIDEIGSLLYAGYHEIVLTGINTALYGRDFTNTEEGEGLMRLLDACTSIDGDYRLRLSSLEPNVIDRDTVRKLLQYDSLCHHMHLSVQSGSDTVLQRMRRRYTIQDYLSIVETLRSSDSEYGITTDIIVGFPGETETEFEETLETVRKIGFSDIHVFKYSPRKQTVAAAMPGQVDGRIKNRRAVQLAEEAERQRKLFHEKNAGRVRRVLFERLTPDGKYLEGYTDNYIQTFVRLNEENRSCLYSFADVSLLHSFRNGMAGNIVTGL